MHCSNLDPISSQTDAFNATAIRSAYMMYLVRQDYRFFVTLTIGGSPAPMEARRRLGLYSAKVDHAALGRSYQRHPRFRARYTAVPERLVGHWHYHLGVTPPQPANPITRSEFEYICWSAWSSICSTGEFHFRAVDNQLELGRYMTKKLHDKAVFENIVHSTEFHRNPGN